METIKEIFEEVLEKNVLKDKEKVLKDVDLVVKKIKVHSEIKRKPVDYSILNNEEKSIVKIIESAEGAIFQSDLVEKSEFDKVKVSRILDRLEGKQLIERKRRGMTNVVILR